VPLVVLVHCTETDVQIACHREKPRLPPQCFDCTSPPAFRSSNPRKGAKAAQGSSGTFRGARESPIPASRLALPERSLCADSRRRGSPLHGMSKDDDA
jgi:hypothetical protein